MKAKLVKESYESNNAEIIKRKMNEFLQTEFDDEIPQVYTVKSDIENGLEDLEDLADIYPEVLNMPTIDIHGFEEYMPGEDTIDFEDEFLRTGEQLKELVLNSSDLEVIQGRTIGGDIYYSPSLKMGFAELEKNNNFVPDYDMYFFEKL